MGALRAELGRGGKLRPAVDACPRQRSRALLAELRLWWILLLAPWASHSPAPGMSLLRPHVAFTMTRRDRERERRALPDVALDPDPPPVQLDELPAESQP